MKSARLRSKINTSVNRGPLCVCGLILFLLFSLLPPPAMAKIPLEVKVTGLDDTLKKNVLHFLDIEKMKKDEELTIRWIKRLHKQAPQEIREALQPYGYYLPDIQSKLTETKGG